MNSVLELGASERQYMNLVTSVLGKFTMEIETEMFLLVISSPPIPIPPRHPHYLGFRGRRRKRTDNGRTPVGPF